MAQIGVISLHVIYMTLYMYMQLICLILYGYYGAPSVSKILTNAAILVYLPLIYKYYGNDLSKYQPVLCIFGSDL